ncbi:hypothetical protein K227x_26500 [Rubripirellula lacrimiformis]|uniref:Uncharacterized protein n=1 Tax=Rubripirellula lacrimiformis TaxID=1930273 RepID=A0A517NAV4_9BACT|nr:hypothetical protein K227x_26500 [Rubripirellula lacrimiformis]
MMVGRCQGAQVQDAVVSFSRGRPHGNAAGAAAIRRPVRSAAKLPRNTASKLLTVRVVFGCEFRPRFSGTREQSVNQSIDFGQVQGVCQGIRHQRNTFVFARSDSRVQPLVQPVAVVALRLVVSRVRVVGGGG